MERAARLFKADKHAQDVLTQDHLACAFWRTAVGKVIASHTSPKKLVRNRLVVEVEDAIWQKQLHALREQILDRLSKVAGTDMIQELEFRVAIPRRTAQRAEFRGAQVTGTHADQDEAERISDPVLKKIYRLSRKRATA